MSKISVVIIPNAKISTVIGRIGMVWKIKLTAPAIEGRANEALIQFLSEILDISPSCIHIIKGHTSKNKIVEIRDITLGQIEEILH